MEFSGDIAVRGAGEGQVVGGLFHRHAQNLSAQLDIGVALGETPVVVGADLVPGAVIDGNIQVRGGTPRSYAIVSKGGCKSNLPVKISTFVIFCFRKILCCD